MYSPNQGSRKVPAQPQRGKMKNRNTRTGKAYGVVSMNSLNDWVWEEFFYNGFNVTYGEALSEYLKKHDGALENTDSLTEKFNDEYYGEEENITLETGAPEMLTLELTYLGGAPIVYVIDSPHVVTCSPCSPCCPGAGDLNNKHDGGIEAHDVPADWYYNPATSG